MVVKGTITEENEVKVRLSFNQMLIIFAFIVTGIVLPLSFFVWKTNGRLDYQDNFNQATIRTFKGAKISTEEFVISQSNYQYKNN